MPKITHLNLSTLTLFLFAISIFYKVKRLRLAHKRVAVILREHLPDDFLPPPPIQTSSPLSESDQGNLVLGRELPLLGGVFSCLPPCLVSAVRPPFNI